jgi:molecular chaperone IbpA
LAVSGFSGNNLGVTFKEDTLTISAKVAKNDVESAYLHRGIAGRSFEHRFRLAEPIKLAGANLVDGLLHIDLTREVPKEKKARKIEIGGDNAKIIEAKAA